jgi:SAM-dependent methyltransferase
LCATNERYHVVADEVLRRRPLPAIHLGDAQDLSTSPLAGFDFIVSQVVLQHVVSKDLVLQESARLLADDGVFIHELDHIDDERPEVLDADLPRFAIRRDGDPISTTAHLERHGVRVRLAEATAGRTAIALFDRASGRLDLDLQLDTESTVGLKTMRGVAPRLQWGVRSVYDVRSPSA